MDLLNEPHLAWHLSGGTTELLLVTPQQRSVCCQKIGGTTDISAGQLIDRTGQLLQLPFPSGKYLDQLSKNAVNNDFFRIKCKDLTFSLSGVQNKVQQYYTNCNNPTETAGFALRCICDAVYKTTLQAKEVYGDLPIVFSGGVASNSMLRNYMEPLTPIFSEPQFSTDNAMGIAVLTALAQEG